MPTPAQKDSQKQSQFKQPSLIYGRESPRFSSGGDISALKNSRSYSKTQIFVVWCTVRISSPERSYLFSLYTQIYNKDRGFMYTVLGAFCIISDIRSKPQLPKDRKQVINKPRQANLTLSPDIWLLTSSL